MRLSKPLFQVNFSACITCKLRWAYGWAFQLSGVNRHSKNCIKTKEHFFKKGQAAVQPGLFDHPIDE
jgi:hypothetical protein